MVDLKFEKGLYGHDANKLGNRPPRSSNTPPGWEGILLKHAVGSRQNPFLASMLIEEDFLTIALHAKIRSTKRVRKAKRKGAPA